MVVLFTFIVLAAAGDSALADEVRVAVDTSSVVNTMRGGIGASWHAIEEPIADFNDGGSGWGGHPPAEDEAAWGQIYRHAEWLGLNWNRVEFSQRMYEPRRRVFDWDNHEMRILYRILDWCEKNKADVMLQQMWANVEWNTFPEWRNNKSRVIHSGPLSMDDFAEGLATMVEHLVKTKGYTCIKWLCITNEPGGPSSWWIKPPKEQIPLREGLEAVRKALDEKGVTVPLTGPDWAWLPPQGHKKVDFHNVVGAYEVHGWFTQFDWRKGGFYRMSEARMRIADWVKMAHGRGKPFFLSELGTTHHGWRATDLGPGNHESSIQNAELIVRCLNVGVDGFNRWSFTNRGNLDGQFQLIDTWDRKNNKLLEHFTPHQNAYSVYGLLSRFTAKYCTTLGCEVKGGAVDGLQRVFAAALRSPRGNLTLAVVNDAPSRWQMTFEVSGLRQPIRLYRYGVSREDGDGGEITIEPQGDFSLSAGKATFADRAEPMSLTVYTTYKLAHGDAGIIAE